MSCHAIIPPYFSECVPFKRSNVLGFIPTIFYFQHGTIQLIIYSTKDSKSSEFTRLYEIMFPSEPLIDIHNIEIKKENIKVNQIEFDAFDCIFKIISLVSIETTSSNHLKRLTYNLELVKGELK